jgi:hypothetical protein
MHFSGHCLSDKFQDFYLTNHFSLSSLNPSLSSLFASTYVSPHPKHRQAREVLLSVRRRKYGLRDASP